MPSYILSTRRFLEDNIDQFFPSNNPIKNEKPLLCTFKPHSRPVPDPKDKITCDLAKQVAMGITSPYQAILSMHDDEDEDTVQLTEYDDNESSSDEYDSEEDDSDYDSEEEEELYQIVGQLRRVDLGAIQEDD